MDSDGQERILQQLRLFIKQLRNVPNPNKDKYAVGTLCSTGELLNDPCNPSKHGSFWQHNGPFQTVQEYADKVNELYDYEPRFEVDTPATFDHMDWFPCNVLVDEKCERVVGLLDWEKAGFIPDPIDNFLRGASIESRRKHQWLSLFNED